MSYLIPVPSRSSSQGLWRGVAALACLMTLFTGMAAPSWTAERSASPQLPRSSPEAQGIASSDILAFIQAADEQVDTMHSFMLVRHGHVVAEGWWGPYDAQTPHVLYSLSKSFTSTAVGLAIAEGKLSLDDEVLKFFPEDAPARALRQPAVDAGARPAAHVHGAPDGSPAPAGRAGDEDMSRGRRSFLRTRSRSSRARTSSTTRPPPTCSRRSCRR